MTDEPKRYMVTGSTIFVVLKHWKTGEGARTVMLEKRIIAGVVGQVLLSVYAIILITGAGYLYFNIYEFIALGVATYVILLLFSILFMLAARRISQGFKQNQLGSVGSVLAFFAVPVGIVLYAGELTAIGYPWGFTFHYISLYFYTPTQLYVLLTLLIDFLLGLGLLFVGVFFLDCRQSISPSALWAVTGIVYVVAGLLTLGMLFGPYANGATIVAGALGAICLLASKPKSR